MIQDNILVVQEVLHQLRVRERKKKFQAVLKVDMQKAYDRVEWDFLAACLTKMGFAAKWIDLIMQCISTTALSIKVNGCPLPYFQPTRGLRQGDPLSPYLFILVSNVLFLMMKQAVQDGTLKGIQLNRYCPTLSHLLFADDSIFFLDGTVTKCQNLSSLLNQYCVASGQAINLNKSGIYFSKSTPRQLRQQLAATMRVPELEKTGKYLGIPSDWGATKKQMFSWILARVQMKLEGWKENLMSKAAKEILIKTVVQALPQYAMSIFKIPVSIYKAIEQKIARFWWKNQSSNSGVHWRSWEVLKSRKDKGGMGFRDLLNFNKAMLGKQAWRLAADPNSVCAKTLKGLYFPNCSFWDAGRGSRPSWGWQSLLLGRDNIEKDVIWSVGNGEQINIRRDKWLLSGRIGGPANRGDPERVSELIKQDQNCWDEPKLNSMFEEQLVQEIKAFKVHPQSTADKLIWTGTKNGTYTVKSNYNLICQEQALTVSLGASSSHQVDQQLWRRIWQMHTPSKIRNFMWLLCQNAIATKENLFKRKMATHPLCPICHTHQETTEHLFLLCGWTAEIWRHPSLQTNTQAHQVTRLDSWLCQFIANRPDLPNFEQIAVTLWHMWKARNEAVFRGKPIFPWMVVEAANSLLSIHQKWNGNQLKNQKGHRSKENRWSPPNPRSIKANIDATYLPDGGTGAIACVCQNSDGVVVGGFVRDAEISSAEQAELTAFVETLKFISERGDLNWILESDCANLISSFTSADQVGDKLSWKLRPLIHEAHGLIKTIPHLQLQFCYRECNRVADWVLKAHRKHALPHSWVFNPPTILVDLLCFDAPVVGSWTFRK